MIEVQHLTKRYGRVTAVDDVSFRVERGEILGFLGPNGAGKSTLFQALLGLVRPWAGTVYVDGQPAHTRPYAFGYVPQTNLVDLDFPVTVRDVAAMGRYARVGPGRRLGQADWQVVDRSLAQVGMADLSARGIGELSGGQRQRVMLARALAQEATVLLLDEPTNYLDITSVRWIARFLTSLRCKG